MLTYDGIVTIKEALREAKLSRASDTEAAAKLTKNRELCEFLDVPRIRPMDVRSARQADPDARAKAEAEAEEEEKEPVE